MRTSPTETPTTQTHCGNSRKPNGKVDGDGRDFGADGQDLDKGVGNTDREARPLIQICLRVDAKGTGDGMRDCHLRDAVGNDECDHSAEEITQDHTGAGEPDGD